MRRTLGGLYLLVPGLALVATSCSSGASGSPTTTTTAAPAAAAAPLARFDVTGTEMHGAPGLPDEALTAVLEALDRYLEVAVVGPLRAGQSPAPGAVEALFTPAAAARLTGGDRASLVEEGGLAAGGRRPGVRRERAQVYLSGLAGHDGRPAVITASVDMAIGAGADVVTRVGELVLVPDAAGLWRIDGYSLVVRRGPR